MKLKSYPKYKETGISWVGDIPDEWSVDKIKRTTYVKGRIGWQGLTSEEYQDEGAYLVTGTDFLKGKINWKSCHHVSLDRFKEDPYIHLKENDLLITKDGTIGKVALVENLQDKATLNSGVFVTRPLEKKYITHYMFWVLNSLVFERFFDYVKKGATISHLYQETFEDFIFPIPSINEQKRISEFLSSKNKNLDSLFDKNIRLIELLEEKRTTLINQAVTRGLDPTTKLKYSGIEWIGAIPEGWTVGRLKNKVILRYGQSLSELERTDGAFKVYGSNGEVGTHIKPITNGATIIIGRKGSYGKLNFSEESCFPIDTTYFVDKKSTQLHLKFLFYVLSQLELDKISMDSAVPGLSREEAYERMIPYVPSSEQIQIAKYLDVETSKIDETIEKIQKRLELLEDYKKSLITNVVTGKIDLREQKWT